MRALSLDARWRRGAVVAGALVIQLVLGAVQAWSVFQRPLGDAFGWTISETTVVFTLNYLAYGFSALPGGLLVARFGPRPVAILAGALYGAGIGLASLAGDRLWVLIETGSDALRFEGHSGGRRPGAHLDARTAEDPGGRPTDSGAARGAGL